MQTEAQLHIFSKYFKTVVGLQSELYQHKIINFTHIQSSLEESEPTRIQVKLLL